MFADDPYMPPESLWPTATDITGDGRFAVVSYCGPRPTVDCFARLRQAARAKDWYDAHGCRRPCRCQHQVIDLADGRIVPQDGLPIDRDTLILKLLAKRRSSD